MVELRNAHRSSILATAVGQVPSLTSEEIHTDNLISPSRFAQAITSGERTPCMDDPRKWDVDARHADKRAAARLCRQCWKLDECRDLLVLLPTADGKKPIGSHKTAAARDARGVIAGVDVDLAFYGTKRRGHPSTKNVKEDSL